MLASTLRWNRPAATVWSNPSEKTPLALVRTVCGVAWAPPRIAGITTGIRGGGVRYSWARLEYSANRSGAAPAAAGGATIAIAQQHRTTASTLRRSIRRRYRSALVGRRGSE